MARLIIDPDNIMISHPDADPEQHDARFERSGLTELLRLRASVLTSTDRAMMQMYLEGQTTMAQIARLSGVSESTVARRIRRLSRELICGRYLQFLRCRRSFSIVECAIARDYFVARLSQVQIAHKRGLSLYRVRRMLARITRLTEEAARNSRRCNIDNAESAQGNEWKMT